MAELFKLENGVNGVCETRPGTKKVTIKIGFNLGSMDELPEENGLTNLMQEAAQLGTLNRTKEKIHLEIESKGTALYSSAGRSNVWFYTECLERHVPEILDVVSDVICNPTFDPAEVESLKAQLCQQIEASAQNPRAEVVKQFMSLMFKGQPAGAPTIGTEELVRSFTPEQIRKKHGELLADPSQMVVAFAGDIEAATAKDLTQKKFGYLLQNKAYAPTPVTYVGGHGLRETSHDQLNLYFGFEGVSETDPDRYTQRLLQELISGGMSSPLFQEVREKRGLVYNIDASSSEFHSTGCFFIATGTGKGQAGELIETTFNVLGDAIEYGFTDEELKEAKARIISSINAQVESASAVSRSQAGQILAHGRIIPLSETLERYESITSYDVQKFCAKMLESPCTLSGVGPLETVPSQDEIKSMMAYQAGRFKLSVTPDFSKSIVKINTPQSVIEIETKDPQISALGNGLKIVTTQRPGSLSCGAWIGAGSSHEPKALNGATHMNEHMMFKGTPSFGPGEIDSFIEGELGGKLNAYTSKDVTAYYFYNLEGQHLDRVLDLCGEMVFDANIDEQEFAGIMVPNSKTGVLERKAGERDVVLEEITRAYNSVEALASYRSQALAFPDQSHGRTVLGTPESLLAMTAEGFLKPYRDQYYSPNNITFSAAGPVTHEEHVAAITKKFGHLKPTNFPDFPEAHYVGGYDVAENDTAELCNMYLLTEGVRADHPDALAYEVFAEIVGDGRSSRLYKTLVDQTNLTASYGSYTRTCVPFGLYNFVTQADAANMKAIVQTFYNQIYDVYQSVSEEELEKVKTGTELYLLQLLETNRGACDTIGRETQANGVLKTLEDYIQEMQNLTVDDIKRVARQALLSNPTVSMVVPTGTDMELLPTYDEVKMYRDKALLNIPAQFALKPDLR